MVYTNCEMKKKLKTKFGESRSSLSVVSNDRSYSQFVCSALPTKKLRGDL